MFEEYLKNHTAEKYLAGVSEYHPFPKWEERNAWEHINYRDAVIAMGADAKQGYPMLKATAFMEYKRTGNRKIYEGPYFERRAKLIHAVAAECAAGDGSFLDAVIDGLWCTLEESSWIISAHNQPGRGSDKTQALPDPDDPVICLFSAQTAQIVAYALYLLEDRLNAQEPIVARRIRTELDRRIFKPFLERDDFEWMGFTGKRLNNWTPWIVSNVMEAFLLVCKDKERRVKAVERAMTMLDFYLALQPEDGGCDEGIGYWNVAGGSVLDCLDELYRATDGKINCYDDPLIRAVGTFPLNAHICGEWYWNFADSDAHTVMDGERIARFGTVTKNIALQRFGERILEKEGERAVKGVGQMNRLLNRLFRQPAAAMEAETPAFVYLPDTQICAYRRGGLYGVIKGGSNNENHNHNDVGSFMIYCGGRPCVVDLGNLVYTAKTFGPERYTLVNTRSANHNVPLIGGIEQKAGPQYAAGMMNADENAAVIEIGGAYPEEAGVESARRLFAVSESAVMLEDEIRLSGINGVSWVFMVLGKPRLENEANTISLGGLRLIYPEGGTVEIAPVPDVDNRMLNRFPEAVYRIEIRYPAEKTQKRVFRFERNEE